MQPGFLSGRFFHLFRLGFCGSHYFTGFPPGLLNKVLRIFFCLFDLRSYIQTRQCCHLLPDCYYWTPIIVRPYFGSGKQNITLTCEKYLKGRKKRQKRSVNAEKTLLFSQENTFFRNEYKRGFGKILQNHRRYKKWERPRPFPKFFWSGKRDSNPRPSAWEADALPTELFPQKPRSIIAIFAFFFKRERAFVPGGPLFRQSSPEMCRRALPDFTLNVRPPQAR